MAQRITTAEAQAWVEGTKFTISDVTTGTNAALLTEIEEEVIARVNSAYDTSTWTNDSNTPRLVRVAIAKKFVAWAYRKAYSESLGDSDAMYAFLLEANAETIIQGIVDGSIEIPTLPVTVGEPIFYPNDASTAMTATADDPSLGPNKFSMGQVF